MVIPHPTPPTLPAFRWAGGKRRLIDSLAPYIPVSPGGRLFEGFAGGAALFFATAPHRAVLADFSPRLIRTYRGIRDHCGAVLEHLARHAAAHAAAPTPYYYATRSELPDAGSDAAVAAWMLYILRAGFNGLMRVNLSGGVNTPKGDCDDLAVLGAPRNLRAVSDLLQHAELRVGGFEDTTADAVAGDAVYHDPPYLYPRRKVGFTAYAGRFGVEDHRRLEAHAWKQAQAGIRVAISNELNATVLDVYPPSRWIPLPIMARRNINRDPGGRGPVAEVLLIPVTTPVDSMACYIPEPLPCLCGCGEMPAMRSEYADVPGRSAHRVRAMRARHRAEAADQPISDLLERHRRQLALLKADMQVQKAWALERRAAVMAAKAAALRATAAVLRRGKP